METEDAVKEMVEAFAAQDLIVREMLSMFIELGHFSKAWTIDESHAGLVSLSQRLTAQAEKSDISPSRSAVLLAFAQNVQKSAARNPAASPRPSSSGGGLQ